MCRFLNGLHHFFNLLIRDGYFQLELRQKIHHILRTAIELCVPFLAAKAFHLSDRYTLNANVCQCFAHVIKLERLNNCCDHFHELILIDGVETGIVIAVALWPEAALLGEVLLNAIIDAKYRCKDCHTHDHTIICLAENRQLR